MSAKGKEVERLGDNPAQALDIVSRKLEKAIQDQEVEEGVFLWLQEGDCLPLNVVAQNYLSAPNWKVPVTTMMKKDNTKSAKLIKLEKKLLKLLDELDEEEDPFDLLSTAGSKGDTHTTLEGARMMWKAAVAQRNLIRIMSLPDGQVQYQMVLDTLLLSTLEQFRVMKELVLLDFLTHHGPGVSKAKIKAIAQLKCSDMEKLAMVQKELDLAATIASTHATNQMAQTVSSGLKQANRNQHFVPRDKEGKKGKGGTPHQPKKENPQPPSQQGGDDQ
jgi:hypothetical protein